MRRPAQGCFLAMLLCVALGPATAQGLRDPTLAPPEAGTAATPGTGRSVGLESGAMSIIVRNGRSYLVVGTRLYAQGQKLGQARIERISETEVWLREGGVLRKVPRFTGIERRSATPLGANSGCRVSVPRQHQTAKGSVTSSSSQTSAAVAPCPHVRP